MTPIVLHSFGGEMTPITPRVTFARLDRMSRRLCRKCHRFPAIHINLSALNRLRGIIY